MTSKERIEELEKRVAELEAALRRCRDIAYEGDPYDCNYGYEIRRVAGGVLKKSVRSEA